MQVYAVPAVIRLRLVITAITTPLRRVVREGGTDIVKALDNDSFVVTDQHGRRRVYGTSNASLKGVPASRGGRCTGGGKINSACCAR
jgi:hypothetical protein